MSSIQIQTEKTDYTGGETIRGRVVLSLTENIPTRGVRIEFYGYEKSYWSTGSGKNRTTHTQTADFYHHELTLFGHPALSRMELLADAMKGIFTKEHYEFLGPGEHAFDFEYTLPPNLPADYSPGDTNYKIAHEVKAYLDIPLSFDVSEAGEFTIYETYDPWDINPVTARNNKTFMFDMGGGSLELEAAIERNMYFPGEVVKGALQIKNDSNRNIKEITVELNHIVHQKAGSRDTTIEDQYSLLNIPHPTIRQGLPAQFDLQFRLPEDLYCSITSSELVRVTYELIINADIPWAVDLDVRVPIRILERAGVPSGVSWD